MGEATPMELAERFGEPYTASDLSSYLGFLEKENLLETKDDSLTYKISGLGLIAVGAAPKEGWRVFKPLPSDKCFRFYTGVSLNAFTGVSAHNLSDMAEKIKTVNIKALQFHVSRGDVERWVKDVLADDELAEKIRRLSNRNLKGDELRNELLRIIQVRVEELTPTNLKPVLGIKGEKAMRVMILTFEYQPKHSGNVSDHVSTLAHELVKLGHEVEVVALDDWRTGFEDVCGVHVHRVANPVKAHPMASILTSATTASIQMECEASNIIYFYKKLGKNINVVHVHDWLTVYPAINLKHTFNIPFVLTFHSIEGHRCHDHFSPISIAIKEIEDMGIWESARVIANTEWMKNEILRYYGGGHWHKIDVAWPIGSDWVSKVVSTYRKVAP